jgi:hypothetical protein
MPDQKLGALRVFQSTIHDTEVTGTQGDDVVKIGVVIETGDPGGIRGASVGSGAQAQHAKHYRSKEVQTRSLSHWLR